MSFSVSNFEFTADLEANHFHCVRYIGPILSNLEKGGGIFYVFEVMGKKRLVLPLAFTWTAEEQEAKLIFPCWTSSLIIPQTDNENSKNYSLTINFYKAPENSTPHNSTLQFKWFAGLGPGDARNFPYEEILPDLLGEKRPLTDGTVLPLIYGGCRYLLQVQRVRDIEIEGAPFDDSVYHFNLQEGNFKFEKLIDSNTVNSAHKIIKILSGKNGSWSEELKFLNFQLKNDDCRIDDDGKEILLLTGIPVVLQEELLNYLNFDFIPFNVCELIPEEHFQLDEEEETEEGQHYNLKNNNEKITFISLLEVENLASPLMSQILIKLSTNKCQNRIVFMTAAVSIESCGQLLDLEKCARQHRFQLIARSFPFPNELERIKIVESESGDDFDLERTQNEFGIFKWVFSSFSITDLMRLGHAYRELNNNCDFKSKTKTQRLSTALEIMKSNQSTTQTTTEFTILSSMPPSKVTFPFYGYKTLQEELNNLLKGPLINSEAYARFGLSMASGFLVHGPTGCGKTSLCLKLLTSSPIKDIFTVIHVPSASQLLSKYFGETEENLRKLFTRARQQRPCIIFIDQIESLGRKRGGKDSEGTSSSSARYLSTLLNEMDGISGNEGVTILACAVDISMLDEALLRPGRLDRHFFLDYPNESDKIEIIKGYLENDNDNDIEVFQFNDEIGKKMISGGQIKSIVMEFIRKK